MKERGTLFNAPMVRAILSGAKSQTRRVVKPQPTFRNDHLATDLRALHERCPYGAPGDRLWVRETFSGASYNEGPPRDWITDSPVWYWADGNPQHGDWTKPRPGMFMPRWASRITLEVTGVRVERLNEISEPDARDEGVTQAPDGWWTGCHGSCSTTAKGAFGLLWESINGAGSWAANPFVWVIAFKRVTP
jgi:hypothetical protein